MAPECLLKNRYNLKADVYSWSMIFWELLTLNKPYFSYSKEQHTLFVCEGGNRPPLESPLEPTLWLSTPSFHTSLSSLPSSSTLEEESIDFEMIMTRPIKQFLCKAWEQDVSKRLTIKEAHDSLERIMDPKQPSDIDDGNDGRGIVSTGTGSTLQVEFPDYGCMPSMAELMMEFATDFRDFSLAACFRQDNSTTEASSLNHPVTATEHEEKKISDIDRSTIQTAQPSKENVRGTKSGIGVGEGRGTTDARLLQ